MPEKKTEKKPILVLDFEKPIRVVLSVMIPRQGECKFIHIFKPPTAEDRLKYYGRVAVNEMARRQAAILERPAGKEKAGDEEIPNVANLSTMAAGVEFYDSLIVRVEGDYQFPRGVDFKEAVPPEHKGWAANILLSTVGILTGSEVKN